jgi:hypothetical protein
MIRTAKYSRRSFVVLKDLFAPVADGLNTAVALWRVRVLHCIIVFSDMCLYSFHSVIICWSSVAALKVCVESSKRKRVPCVRAWFC